jgi:hypothetical protein
VHANLATLAILLGTLAATDQPQSPTLVARSDATQQQQAAAPDESAFVGDWKGESLVVVKNSPAKDEDVVWHIAKAGKPGMLSVRADKIVDGRTISMGTLPFKYDKTRNMIVCEFKQGVWRLNVKAYTMEGTLTRPDGTVFRRVNLKKSE